MKKTIFKLILITLFLVASGAVQARVDFSGGDPPFCIPGKPQCPVN
jgi:hypothetical protein